MIGERAFLQCRKLKSVAIPKSVKKLGMESFYLCKNLTSAEIPENVTEIGVAAFNNCPNLVIHSTKGANAIEYAKENGIKYVEI